MRIGPPASRNAVSCCDLFFPPVQPVPNEVHDNESLQPVSFQRRVRWPLVGILVGVVVLSMVVASRFARRSLMDYDETFRPSEPVSKFPASVRRKLYQVLRSEPEWCGVAAPNLRRYQQVAVLHMRGFTHDVMNPSWYPAPNTVLDRRMESSEMCHGENITRIRDRPWGIFASFDTVHTGRIERFYLEGAEARCFQHFVDVFAGDWPCRGSDHTLDILMIPRLPVGLAVSR